MASVSYNEFFIPIQLNARDHHLLDEVFEAIDDAYRLVRSEKRLVEIPKDILQRAEGALGDCTESVLATAIRIAWSSDDDIIEPIREFFTIPRDKTVVEFDESGIERISFGNLDFIELAMPPESESPRWSLAISRDEADSHNGSKFFASFVPLAEST